MNRKIDNRMPLIGSLPQPVNKVLRNARNVLNGVHQYMARIGLIKSVPAFWADALNFGDLLTPELLKSYGVRPIWTQCSGDVVPPSSTLVSCGSILGWVSPNFHGYVIGSGLGMMTEAKDMPNVRFMAVRGRLTKSAMRLGESVGLGDPGLLSGRLISKKNDKKWTLGIIPHQIDQNSKITAELQKRLEMETSETDIRVKLISTRQMPKDVIEDICACEYVVSSSLHGLVIADAFGIPNARVRLSEKIGDFKFQDYYSAYDEELTTTVVPMGGGGGKCWSRAAKCRRKGCR